MGFRCGMGDFIAMSGLAVRVYTAYKNAPGDYQHIAEEVAALQILIDKAARQFRSTTLSRDDHQYGQKALTDCQSVLEDLDFFIKKYKSPASTNKRPVVKRGKGDITALKARLISNTVLLNGFVRSCEYMVAQTQLTTILGLDSSNSRIPLSSIASFAANPNTEIAYKQFCGDVYEIGVTEDMIHQQEDNILEILRSQGMITRSQTSGSNSGGQVNKPSFRLSSRIHWFRPGSGAGALIPEAIGRDNNSALLNLVADNPDTTQLLLWKGAVMDQNDNTLLHSAAGGGHTNTVKLLLDKGAPIAAMNKNNDTPLHLAIKNGHTAVVELLLPKGASIEALRAEYNTLLHFAAQKGQTGVVELLLEKGAGVEAMAPTDNISPLHVAAENGHTGVVELLLEKGARVEAMAPTDNSSPLHLAAENGHADIVELLLKRKASIDAVDYRLNTSLHIASRGGHTGVAKLLVENGASIDVKNGLGNNPLHLAAYQGHTTLAELLLGKRASVEVKNAHGSTPLHIAAGKGHTGVVKLLLAHGAPIEATNAYGSTPLRLAEKLDIVELLTYQATKRVDQVTPEVQNERKRGWWRISKA